jgi:hypothetical protein
MRDEMGRRSCLVLVLVLVLEEAARGERDQESGIRDDRPAPPPHPSSLIPHP